MTAVEILESCLASMTGVEDEEWQTAVAFTKVAHELGGIPTSRSATPAEIRDSVYPIAIFLAKAWEKR